MKITNTHFSGLINPVSLKSESRIATAWKQWFFQDGWHQRHGQTPQIQLPHSFSDQKDQIPAKEVISIEK